MDREEISDECDNLCFGLESLIQPLKSSMCNCVGSCFLYSGFAREGWRVG